jgi:FMN reductase
MALTERPLETSLPMQNINAETRTKPLRPLIVGIGGTTRPGSTCEAALRYALSAAEKAGTATEIFTGNDLNLPAFEPGNSARGESVQRMVDALRRADGLIIASPGYHGSISGLIKNALDYTEDMRDDPSPYIDGRAVGCIVLASGAQALGSTLAALRSIVHALRGWPTPLGATILSTGKPFQDGKPTDAEVARTLEVVAQQVVSFAQMKRSWVETGSLQKM